MRAPVAATSHARVVSRAVPAAARPVSAVRTPATSDAVGATDQTADSARTAARTVQRVSPADLARPRSAQAASASAGTYCTALSRSPSGRPSVPRSRPSRSVETWLEPRSRSAVDTAAARRSSRPGPGPGPEGAGGAPSCRAAVVAARVPPRPAARPARGRDRVEVIMVPLTGRPRCARGRRWRRAGECRGPLLRRRALPRRDAPLRAGAGAAAGLRLQVLVVDDGSTDSSAEILAGIVHPALTVLHQDNRGNVAARNLALARASGDVVAFCDADDVWLPGKLAAQLRALGDDATAVCCAVRYLSPAGDRLASKGLGLDEGAVRRLLLDKLVMPVPLSGWVFRQSAPPLRMDDSLPVGADLELAVRAAERGRVAYVPDALTGYRVHPGSITASRLRTQQQVRRFLARRAGDEAAGAGFEAWVGGRRAPWRERAADLSARHLRRGADAWSAGARARAAGHLVVAVVASPLGTGRKLRRRGASRVPAVTCRTLTGPPPAPRAARRAPCAAAARRPGRATSSPRSTGRARRRPPRRPRCAR